MESRYSREKVCFKKLEDLMQKRGITGYVLEKEYKFYSGTYYNYIIKDGPVSTGHIAKLCYILKCTPNDIMDFEGIEVKEEFKGNTPFYTPSEEATGKVTYETLRKLVQEFYRDREEKKTMNDLFDSLPKPKITVQTEKGLEAMLAARGLKAESPKRKSYTTGIPFAIRTKITNDRSLRLSYIYDICDLLGCTPSWVLSYK